VWTVHFTGALASFKRENAVSSLWNAACRIWFFRIVYLFFYLCWLVRLRARSLLVQPRLERRDAARLQVSTGIWYNFQPRTCGEKL